MTEAEIQELKERILPELKSALLAESQGVGEDDVRKVDTLSGITSLLAYLRTGGDITIVEAPLSLLGADLRVNDTHIQFKVGDKEWGDLISLSELKKPATDAAAEAKKATDLADQATKNANEATRQAQEATKGADNATNNANTAAVTAATNAKEAKARADEAGEQAAEARRQGDYAQEEGDKASLLSGEIDYLKGHKVDGAFAENGFLYLTANGEPVTDPIELPAGIGGGGGGGGSILRVKIVGGATVSALEGDPVEIHYSFSSLDFEDKTPTGDGDAVYEINSIPVLTEIVRQGGITRDVSRYMIKGSNTVKVTVTDSFGASRSISWRVEIVNISISSPFDPAQTYSGNIPFKFTPLGLYDKVIHLTLDGVEIGSVETTSSGRQMTFDIPGQTHGAHLLKAYATAIVNSVQVKSNELVYDIICIEPGNETPVIASTFSITDTIQQTTLSVPFMVYSPAAALSPVSLSVDGAVVSERSVDRSPQTWSVRLDKVGDTALRISCGNVVRAFSVAVRPISVDVSAETADLDLFLTSAGRSNNEIDPAIWEYGDIKASMTGFNFVTDGWIRDKGGDVALRVSGGARVEIPLKIFEKDLRANGKTIEFEFATSEIEDYNETIISCFSARGLLVTPQSAVLTSELSAIMTRFKEEEKVRVSFVVEERSAQRLIYTYINGVISGIVQYPDQDNFLQKTPVNISLGGDKCTLDVYNIRIYDNGLSQYQALNNYIADRTDVGEKVTLFNRNQIYDAYGDIQYDRLLEELPCMIIIGDLPGFKGDKKTVSVSFTDKKDPSRGFTATGVTIDVQGTSSQYYPRKNYKLTFKGGFIMTVSGEAEGTYALRTGSVPVNCFCVKADFAESSGTHNTGFAKLADSMLRSLGYLTPPQLGDTHIRTTVDGYPIVIFHRRSDSDSPYFLGKYNFNNDKSTQDTFGLSGAAECWEVLNNTSDRVLFKSSDYSTDDWLNDFEGRYPDGNTDCSNLMVLTDWIVSTRDNPEKFKAECAGHFNVDFLLFYYVATELFAMVDQRAKNMMLASWGNGGSGAYRWYPVFYDSDTINGLNNEGDNIFDYTVEYHDRIGSQNVYNGADSVLWNNVETAFANEIRSLYQKMRQLGVVSYASAIGMFNTEQSGKWCESVYNADTRFKYIDPLVEEGNGAYLYAAQGSREEHRKWWLYNRFRYIDSKYVAGDFLSDYITMRLYTPAEASGVTPNADFDITTYGAGMYVTVKYGSYQTSRKITGSDPVTIKAPAMTFNDTETIIYGASRVKSLGDLSGKYAGTIDVSKAVKLSELVVGSLKTGYENTNLTHISLGNNRMLKRLDIRNCPRLTQQVDVSGCENIEVIYASGTSISSVGLARGGNVNTLDLPDTITNLTLRNQPKLKPAGLIVAGYQNVTTLVLEGMPLVPYLSTLSRCVNIERIRLIGINNERTTDTVVYKLLECKGVDDNGYTVDTAIVTGSCSVPKIGGPNLKALNKAFPEFIITADLVITPVEFADPLTRSICVSKWGNGAIPGDVTEEELAKVYDIGLYFKETDIVSFDEFRFFTILTTVTVGPFKGCTKLKSIILPERLKHISQECFIDCSSLEHIEIPESVTNIDWGAFRNCSMLTSVRLPTSITSLGSNVFYKCSKLAAIEIPDRVGSIGSETFFDCSSLASVKLPSNLTRIESKCFQGCSSLEVIDIPGGVSYLNDHAFSGCTSLKHVTLPSALKPLYNNDAVFSNCTALESVEVPYGVTDIGKQMFDSCRNISSVSFPDSLTTIGDQAFTRCYKLEYVELPDSITSIGKENFDGVKRLRIKASIPPALSYQYWTGIETIEVPAGSVEAYKTASTWIQYADKIKPIED